MLSVVIVAVALFLATNIDDIFILVAFFANPKLSARQVVAGQFIGIAALVALSLAGALLAFVVPPEYVGILGLVPIALGVIDLVKLVRRRPDADNASGDNHARVVGVALVTIANGGDNVGAYVPVFATSTPLELVVITSVFLVLTGCLCLLGNGLVTHPRLGPPIIRVANVLAPFVLVAVGVWIVVETSAYRLVL